MDNKPETLNSTSTTTLNNIVFLDIDGVLHPPGAVTFTITKDRYLQVVGTELFRWTHHLLEILKDFPEVRIIIHSSWRTVFGWNYIKDTLPSDIIDLTLGVTNEGIAIRYMSILDTVEEFGITDYVILDDEHKAFPWEIKELIRVYPEVGMSHDLTKDLLRYKLGQMKFSNEKNS